MIRRGCSGFTLVELLVVVAIFGVLVAIATPALQRARQSGNESSAIGSLRTVSTAQFMYQTTCGQGFFAPSLSDLSTPPPAGTAFIGPDLGYAASVIKSGYTFEIGSSSGPGPNSPDSCNGVAAGGGLIAWFATGTPAIGSGSRAFGVNVTGTIYYMEQFAPLAMTDMTAPAGAKIIPQ